MDGLIKFLSLRWLGVELEIIATVLVTALSLAALVGWIEGFKRSRVLQALVAVLILAPGGTAFAINQFKLDAWWSWVIGVVIGLAGLPFVVRAARRAPALADAAVDAAANRAEDLLRQRPGASPGAGPDAGRR